MVGTPYGNGKIISIRTVDGTITVEPINWVLSLGKKPKFYLRQNNLTPYNPNEDIITVLPPPNDKDSNESSYSNLYDSVCLVS